MIFSGIQLTTLIGQTLPVPTKLEVTDSIESVEITHSDQLASGFQLTLQAGRSGVSDLMNYVQVDAKDGLGRRRVIFVVTFGAKPTVLFDGFITHIQLQPSPDPGSTKYILTGYDVSIAMDLEEVAEAHPSQPESIIATTLIGKYPDLGLIPKVIKPDSSNPPMVNDWIPFQRGTDYAYLTNMAERFGFVFCVMPGDAAGTNIAYWGPRIQKASPQSPLSVNQGAESNVDTINFTYDSLAPTTVEGTMQDKNSKSSQSISQKTTSLPTMADKDPMSAQQKIRKELPNVNGYLSAQDVATARARIAGRVDLSIANAAGASGTLDSIRYGGILRARQTVQVRGVGATYDGEYYVKKVTHSIKKGEYKQHFELSRPGLGTDIQSTSK